MNSPLPQTKLSDPPIHNGLKTFSDLSGGVSKLFQWARMMRREVYEQLETHRQQLNTQVQGVGTAIQSAGIVTVNSPTHHITGTATVNTINASAHFSGPIHLIADGGFSLGTSGNIALARGPFSVGQSTTLVFDPATAKWYPH